jgi:PTH1 family peptidyl-tRNA hydrolase
MILIVGLGNPGKKYLNNRHNVGHMFMNFLISKLTDSQISGLKLAKTDDFMNLSGVFVKKLVRNSGSEPENLIIVHDDLDIPLGKFHIQFASGPQLHNGLESIEQHLNTKDFYRIRIGVDNRPTDRKIPGEKYALQNFQIEEKQLLESEIFPKIFIQLQLHLKNLFKVSI